MFLVSQKTKLPIVHDDFLEMAPLDWHKKLTVRYHFERRDLSALDVLSKETFLMGFEPTLPVFIETDGVCAGNPGPGGWGTIVNQGDAAVEMHGQMELRAIDEALKFLPADFKGHVVIETDSKGCMETMMGRGQRWQRDNYVNLRGNRVKNREFVDSIIERLKTLTVEYRKVEGHSGDQWNDRADALAVMGRNEAASWPQCSFDVIMPIKATIPSRRDQSLRSPRGQSSLNHSQVRHTSDSLHPQNFNVMTQKVNLD
jgi:ribonuclease HI